MTLKQFIANYDFVGSIILLEGKRKVAESDQPKLRELGELLADKMRYATFRSGNANGADLYFSQGVVAVDAKRLEVVIPVDGHRKKSNLALSTLSLDEVKLADYPDIVSISALNIKTIDLLKRYLTGERNRFTNKVAFIIRDTIKVLGVEGYPPISFGIFYDDPFNPKSGGTGHTMKACEHAKVQYLDQSIWMKWTNKKST